MRFTIIAILLFFANTSSAQNVEMTKSVHDDGKTLRLTYKATVDDKRINYENTFDVDGWTKTQKDLRIKNIIDSLHNAPGETRKKVADYSKVKIDDNGTRLTLTVDYKSAGQTINFTNTYDVKGKNQPEKDAMVAKILAGLGVK
ncbi:MAG: hypothetical protein JWP69_1633 [Flaviaesturariibacter sp.]|nr:hypothetical protein [Flaviaesturariibacter sp.]